MSLLEIFYVLINQVWPTRDDKGWKKFFLTKKDLFMSEFG